MKESSLIKRTFIRSYGRFALLIVLGMLLLFLDFFSKAYIYHLLSFFDGYREIHCINIPVFYDFAGIDFLITPALNKGAAWGLFADFQIVLVIMRILVILAIFFYLFFLKHNSYVDFPLMLIITGAIGNVLDFFLYGFVVDFLHFNLWGYNFPVFNFADSCITLGVIWLFLGGLFKSKKPITTFK